MTDDEHTPRPARREPMLWLVFGLPALVVVASLVTVWIAGRDGNQDAVADDVRRTAQMQTTELAPDEAAARLGLTAVLSVQEGKLVVVPATGTFPRDATLALRLAHPMHADRDLRVALPPDALGWSAAGKVDAGNDWKVTLQDAGGDWRIVGRLQAGQDAVRLAPALAAQ